MVMVVLQKRLANNEWKFSLTSTQNECIKTISVIFNDIGVNCGMMNISKTNKKYVRIVY